MKVEKFVTGIISTNCYLAIHEESKRAVIIDPAACPPGLLRYMKDERIEPEAILLTHAHFDHIMGIDGILDKYRVPVYVHEKDLKMLEDPQWNQSSVYTAGYTYSGAAGVRDGQVLPLAGMNFRVLHTPGHTPGGCCYYVEDAGVLFSGDTLFQASVGRTDFPGSSMSDLIQGIREKLLVLPENTLVYPGHMGETTIGYEKQNNPFI